ncbi:SS18-like protein 2 [Prionailurus iriomotensis]
MSVAFVPDWLKGKAEVNQETIQRLLEENDQLIRCIVEYQNKGRANECVHSCYLGVKGRAGRPVMRLVRYNSLGKKGSGLAQRGSHGSISANRYQHVLHRNLIYLATIADANPTSPSKPME